MREENDNSAGARIGALEAKVDAALQGLAAQIANLSQSAQDTQPGVCITSGVDPSAFVIADCSASASSESSQSGSEGLDACSFDSGGATVQHSAWEIAIDKEQDGTLTYTLKHCYYNKAGVTYDAGDLPLDVSGGSLEELTGIIAVKFELVNGASDGEGDSDSGTDKDKVSVALYSDISAINSLQRDPSLYVVPLYSKTAESDWIDLRTSVQLQVFDFANF